jgi:hypothetical protein
MSSSAVKLTINYLAFQAGWFACVLGSAKGYPILGPAVVLVAVGWHLFAAQRPSNELTLLICCALIGLVFDSLLLATGWVEFANGMLLQNLAPYWMVALWVVFATSLNQSMAWLRGRPLLAAVFGAFGGPLSYLAGAKLGAMTLVSPTLALLALAVGWALIMPILVKMSVKYDGFKLPSSRSDILFGSLNHNHSGV